MSYQPWPVILPLLVFVAAPARALEPWGLPDFRERDKQEHFAGGALIGAAADAATKSVSPRSTWLTRALIGVAAAAVAGTAKEICDAQHPDRHSADPKDALATVAGGVAGSLAIELVWHF